ncbi:hypothetical protein HDU97_004451 [Phlyctochytrium planicorne]|nr:hypothetical protein HDU97_004451 [Phlyctochytrium planicorne]
MVIEVKDKVALITGGSSGFGEALAERLADKGCKIIASDINEKDGTALVKRLNEKHGDGSAIFVVCDVSDGDQLESLFKTGVAAFGRLDIVVNNAGINESHKLFQGPGRKWSKVLDVNLTAVIHGTELAINQMLTQSPKGSGGVIVNTASISGLVALGPIPVYSASKHGVVGVTRALGATPELRQLGIRVNCVAPVFAETGITREAFETRWDAVKDLVLGVGLVSVNEVVDAMIMAIENESFSGTILQVTEAGIHEVPPYDPKTAASL